MKKQLAKYAQLKQDLLGDGAKESKLNALEKLVLDIKGGDKGTSNIYITMPYSNFLELESENKWDYLVEVNFIEEIFTSNVSDIVFQEYVYVRGNHTVGCGWDFDNLQDLNKYLNCKAQRHIATHEKSELDDWAVGERAIPYVTVTLLIEGL